MRRIFSSLTGLAFLVALGTASALAKDTSSNSMSNMSSMSGMAAPKSCPKGEVPVKGHMTKDGKMVKGYCRKSASPKPAASKSH